MMERAQGAMEYLMSYGWAILVALVVGVTVWQLGILDLSGSTPPTSSGFEEFKPLLATCKYGDSIWEAGAIGFQCQFVNAAGIPARVRNLDVKVNGRACHRQKAQNSVGPCGNPNTNCVWQQCASDDPATCVFMGCWRFDSAGVFHDCVADGTGVLIGSDDSLFVGIYTWGPPNTFGPCVDDFKGGQRYLIDFDITYDVEIGGIEAERHSIGTVSMTA